MFKDEGVSGTKEAQDRPAFADLLAALHANGVRSIIVERLDRLSRSLVIQETIICDLQKSGFSVVSAEEPDMLGTDPTRVLLRQFCGAIAEWEKSVIVQNLRGARERMRKNQGRCEGRKPFGFFEGEDVVIERMKALRASGMAFDKIAATLNSEGVPTRKVGKKWHGFTVNKILEAQK